MTLSQPSHDELQAKAERFLPGGSFGNLGLDALLVRGDRGRVWDASGQEYVDFLLGSGPLILGHNIPQVTAAVKRQAEKGATFFSVNDQGILLAEAIVKAVPCAEQVRYLGSGTEANAYAMRLARAWRGRDKILKFEGAYHGMSDYGLVSLNPPPGQHGERGVRDCKGIPENVLETMLVCPYNDIARAEALIETYKDELAAVIVEPIQRVVGPVAGFLERLRELTQKHGILLIFDEVVTGFRLAYGGAQDYFGVTPDLCTLGKSLGGGYPIAAVAGRADIMAHFDRGKVSPSEYLPMVITFGGNPISSVAGLETLKILNDRMIYDQIFASGRRLWQGIEKALSDNGHEFLMLGVPVMFDAFFTSRKTIVNYSQFLEVDHAKGVAFNKLLRKHGVMKGDAKIYIAWSHTEDDIDAAIEGFSAAARDLAAL